MATVSSGSREDRRQADDGYSFRTYRTPRHYVVAAELLDEEGEPLGDRTRLLILRASDLERVATALL